MAHIIRLLHFRINLYSMVTIFAEYRGWNYDPRRPWLSQILTALYLWIGFFFFTWILALKTFDLCGESNLYNLVAEHVSFVTGPRTAFDVIPSHFDNTNLDTHGIGKWLMDNVVIFFTKLPLQIPGRSWKMIIYCWIYQLWWFKGAYGCDG